MLLEIPSWIRNNIWPAQYPLSMIISSFTPNQQGQNILQVQLSTIFPDRFHAMTIFVVIINFYNVDAIFL